MASVINTNIASLNAQRNLSTSQNSLTTSLQRLSSGLRINSAKDDAAGLSIATRIASQINGLNQVSSKRIWISRPTRELGTVQILPVDWFAITEEASTNSNYQILPGDRVFVAEDKMVAFDTHLGKLLSPFERMMGFTLLGTGTVTRLSGPVLKGGGNQFNNGGFGGGF